MLKYFIFVLEKSLRAKEINFVFLLTWTIYNKYNAQILTQKTQKITTKYVSHEAGETQDSLKLRTKIEANGCT